MKKKKVKFANSDYLYSSLPNTRKDAFKDVYKHNFLTILKCGVALLISIIPVLVFSIFMDIGRLGMTPANYCQDDLAVILLLWHVFRGIGFTLLLAVTVLILSGVMRILKLVIYQEGVDFFYDLKVGIKENFSLMLVFYLLYMLIYNVTNYLRILFLSQYVGLVVLLIFFILFTPMLLWAFLTISVYQTKFWEYMKNSLFFFMKTVGFSLLFIFIIIWPFILSSLVADGLISIPISPIYIAAKNVVFIVMSLFYYPCVIIITLLFASSKFDKYINKDNYPEIYRKGLYEPKKQTNNN